MASQSTRSLFAFLCLLTSSLAFIVPLSKPTAEDNLFNWTAVTPSWDLEYHTCYESFECARLLLPLDWLNLSNTNTIALAVIRLPAVVDHSFSSYGGAIITNPGGPGGSGVQFIYQTGKTLQKYVDSEEKKYDILSFDPRGIWQTTPRVDCYRDTFARSLSDFRQTVFGNVDIADENGLKGHLAFAKAFGSLCERSLSDNYENGDNIAHFVSTASVARDMLEMVDKVDIWEKGVQGIRGRVDNTQKPLSGNDGSLPRLQYWGFSYGTHLGNTFASMFPNRVGRMILDGVMDANEYVTLYFQGWLTALLDTEQVVDHFYDACFRAGPKCALYSSLHSSGKDIKRGVDMLRDRLRTSPVPVVQDHNITLFTATDFEEFYYRPWYAPIVSFPKLALDLSQMLAGNFTSIVNNNPFIKHPVKESCSNTCLPGPLPPSPAEYWDNPDDASFAVMCSDGEDATNTTIEDLKSQIIELHAQSPSLGGTIATMASRCVGWSPRVKYRFTGPFTTPPASGVASAGPSVPLLLLASQFDPVTPLKSAIDMSKGHPGSVVVAQNSYGHCSLLAAPSNCTENIIKRYFADGVLPEVAKNGREDGPDNLVFCEAGCSNPWEECPQYRRNI